MYQILTKEKKIIAHCLLMEKKIGIIMELLRKFREIKFRKKKIIQDQGIRLNLNKQETNSS